ncbi:unnamed protein product [Cyprideis torosa]|uniref:Uncharacterized protein n=1 Tax=Cyprideis torosa TaxID=163714 RepID=A0A7R8WGF7_9CRUS|nr:unnamed protein product [Cyprideis torosa]CAG0891683.1 unnamed protein product [Cyprideis torosa]
MHTGVRAKGKGRTTVVASGPGLAFIAYPEAVARLPVSPLWSILFFVMLLTLGLGTQFTIMETVVTTIQDLFPSLLRRYRILTLATCCTVMFLLGLSMCSEAGMYILQLADNHAATFSALIVGSVESIAITHVYGINRFMGNIGESEECDVLWEKQENLRGQILKTRCYGAELIEKRTRCYGAELIEKRTRCYGAELIEKRTRCYGAELIEINGPGVTERGVD